MRMTFPFYWGIFVENKFRAMKKTFALLFILAVFTCGLQAQNYRMLNAASEYFFFSSASPAGLNYVYGLKCDSVNSISGDSIFYPYRTLAQIAPLTDTCNMDDVFPIWAGTTIKVNSSNRHYWKTMSGDSVIVSSLTNPGDTQQIYLYPNGDRIVGIHTVNAQMGFANITDSVKKYTLLALNSSNTIISSYWNGKEIIISKNNGVVQMPTIAGFPADTVMYSRAFAKRLKYGDIYTWQPGDELHERFNLLGFTPQAYDNWLYNKYILARNQVTPDSVVFTIRRITHHTDNYPPINTIVIDTITFSVGRLSSYIETAMPQQTIYANNNAYTYDLLYDTADCGKLRMIDHVRNSVFVSSCVYYEMFEPYIHDDISVEGVVGYLFTEQPHFLNNYTNGAYTLLYYYINGNSCGTAMHVNTGEAIAPTQLHVWPNPVTDILNLELPVDFSGTLEIYDISGKQIQSIALQKGNAVDVHFLADGFYFGKLVSAENGNAGYIRFVKN